MYSVTLSKKAAKQIPKLPAHIGNRVVRIIDQLQSDPTIGKRLSGELEGLWSIRVWPYRIIYMIIHSDLIIDIVSVDHRKDVYRKL